VRVRARVCVRACSHLETMYCMCTLQCFRYFVEYMSTEFQSQGLIIIPTHNAPSVLSALRRMNIQWWKCSKNKEVCPYSEW